MLIKTRLTIHVHGQLKLFITGTCI